MCDPLTIALSVAKGVMQLAQSQAVAKQVRQQNEIARQQALASYDAAQKQIEAEYAEANRQIAEAQEAEVEEASDLIREANEQLGTLRVSETALSDSSLGNLFFESYYTNSLNLYRLDENVDKQISASESLKGAALQSYLTTVRGAENRAQNILAQNAAKTAGSGLNMIGSAIQSGADMYSQERTLDAIKGSG